MDFETRDTEPVPAERDTIPPPPPGLEEVLRVVVDISSAACDHEEHNSRCFKRVFEELGAIRGFLASISGRIDQLATNSERVIALEDWKRRHESTLDHLCDDCPRRDVL